MEDYSTLALRLLPSHDVTDSGIFISTQQAMFKGGNHSLSILGMNSIFLYVLQLGPNLGNENLHFLYRPLKDACECAHRDSFEALYETEVVPGSNLFLVKMLALKSSPFLA